MEDIKPIDKDYEVPKPFSLQSLCSKIILMQENYKQKMFHDKINEEMSHTNTNMLSSNLGADKLSQNLYFGPEIINTDFLSENLNLDINTEEWMNMKEFDKYIHELKVVEPFSDIENDFPELAENDVGIENDFIELTKRDVCNFSYTQVGDAETKPKTFQDDFIAYSGLNLENNKAPEKNLFQNNTKTETADKDIIIISSSEDSDFELSLPDDIDTISLSSIEAFEKSIKNDSRSKVTIEISPQIEYVTNFNEKADTKEIRKDLLTKSLSSSSISSITDVNKTKNSVELDDSFCSGYDTSDFEFITEEEAKTDGLIINYKKTKGVPKNETCRTVEVTAYNANTHQCNHTPFGYNNTEDYRQNHQIPEGENYFDLFRGIYAPAVPWMYENKSMGLLMNEYAGVGFDIGVLSRQIKEYQPDDEYKEEADECAKKILKMYPSENRKRRRRCY